MKDQKNNKSDAGSRIGPDSTNSCGESNTRYGYAAASTPLRTAFSSSILAVRTPIRQKRLKVMRQWMKASVLPPLW